MLGSMSSMSSMSDLAGESFGDLKRKKSLSITKNNDSARSTSSDPGGQNDVSRGVPSNTFEVRDIEEEYNKMEEIMKQRGFYFSPDPDAESEENKKKNRYRDVLPNRQTSVKLEQKGSNCGKYINANYVSDRTSEGRIMQKYICCQAPLPDTFIDFWTMIWEKNCPVVVMLTRLAEQDRPKADTYWPETEGSTRQYGYVMVTLKKVKIHKGAPSKPGFFKKISLFNPKKKEKPTSNSQPDMMASSVFKQPMAYFLGNMKTKFDMKSEMNGSIAGLGSVSSFAQFRLGGLNNTMAAPANNEPLGSMVVRKFTLFDIRDPSRTTRDLAHLHYTEWPDRGVPDTTEQMSKLIRELDIRKKGLEDPIVVHCSAGIGRTGTFLAIHMALQQVALGITPYVDIFETVLNLRVQRRGMVQSTDQYKFVYVTIKDMLMDKYNNYNANTRSKQKSILNTSQTQVDHVRSAIQTAPKNRPRRSASEPILEDCWTRIIEEGELMEKMKLT